MQSVHPGPNAGNGRLIDQSLYLKKSDKKDNFVQCAQCGWYVNLDERATGDDLGLPDPTTSSDTVKPPAPGISFTENFGVPVVTQSGCPFCRSLNVKGKLRDRLFGSGVSIEGY